MSHPSMPVLEHLVNANRRSWQGPVLTSFLLPVLYLLVLGLWVGGYVDARGLLPAGYIDYIGPGLLAATTLQVAANESAGRAFASFTITRTYHAMVASPLRVTDVLVGSLGYVLLRVLVTSAAFLAVLAGFGAVHSVWAVLAIGACILVGLAMAAAAFAYAASISHVGGIPLLSRLVVIPMMLFAGVLFPVEALPPLPRWLVYASPLWHGVELCRAATLGMPTAWGVGSHTGYLLLWSAAAFWLAHARFRRRLHE